MMVHLPPVFSAVVAHSRAKRIRVSRPMPVYFSCQAGV